MADLLSGVFGDQFNIGNMLLGLLTNGMFWAALIIVLVGAGIFFLKRRKAQKMKIRVFKVTDLGNNKIGMIYTKAGRFKKQRKFFGLWETGGEDEILTKEGEVIYGYSPQDFQEVDFQKTLFVIPSHDDPRILFPLSRFNISDKTKELLMDMAPIEIREAAIDSHKKTIAEMKDFREQIVQWVLIGMFFISAFLSIMFITQYAKHAIDKAAEIVASAQGAKCEIQQQQGGIPSNAP